MEPFVIGSLRAAPGERVAGDVPVPGPDGAAGAQIPVIILHGARPGKAVVVCGGIHGNEYSGIEAVTRLARDLNPADLCGTVVAVPIVHGASFDAEEPTSGLDKLNLNRSFPGDPNGSPTQRLAHVFLNEIVLKCNGLIDLHTGGKAAILPQVIAQRGFEALAWGLARATGIDLYWRGGSWGGTGRISALQAGVPAITVEAGGGMDCNEGDVTIHTNAVLNALKYFGVVAGAPQASARWRVIEADSTYAGAAGYFAPTCKLGDRVAKGQLIGVIRDALGRTLEELRAPLDGMVSLIRVVPHVRAGDEVLILGQVVRDQDSPA